MLKFIALPRGINASIFWPLQRGEVHFLDSKNNLWCMTLPHVYGVDQSIKPIGKLKEYVESMAFLVNVEILAPLGKAAYLLSSGEIDSLVASCILEGKAITIKTDDDAREKLRTMAISVEKAVLMRYADLYCDTSSGASIESDSLVQYKYNTMDEKEVVNALIKKLKSKKEEKELEQTRKEMIENASSVAVNFCCDNPKLKEAAQKFLQILKENDSRVIDDDKANNYKTGNYKTNKRKTKKHKAGDYKIDDDSKLYDDDEMYDDGDDVGMYDDGDDDGDEMYGDGDKINNNDETIGDSKMDKVYTVTDIVISRYEYNTDPPIHHDRITFSGWRMGNKCFTLGKDNKIHLVDFGNKFGPIYTRQMEFCKEPPITWSVQVSNSPFVIQRSVALTLEGLEEALKICE